MANYTTYENKYNSLKDGITASNDTITINYAGKQLPADRAMPVHNKVSPLNDPSLITLSWYFSGTYQEGNLNIKEMSVTLEPNTQIRVNGEKVIATSTILDGPPVFERITTQPIEVEFEGKFLGWDVDASKYIFPQTEINNVWSIIWEPNTVLNVTNTWLNNLGFQELIVKSISLPTARGTTSVPFTLRTYVNTKGKSLVI